MKRFLPLLLAAGCSGTPFPIQTLGDPAAPEWADLVPERPEGRFEFEGTPNAAEETLVVWADNVRQAWTVELNGRSLGRLPQYEVPVLTGFAVPPGLLARKNVVLVKPPKARDDVRVGVAALVRKPLSEWSLEQTLEIRVVESPKGAPVPCRITIVDEDTEALPPLAALPGQRLAVRPGCVYTGDGRAKVALPRGRYRVHAGRGFEYSVDTRRVSGSASVDLVIRREVPTATLAACDTHVHTLQYSGHGDATALERALTLAGEGIELAVCTEHNRHASYAEAVREAGLERRLTTVPGNEVTTAKGHFNVFPIAPGAPVPDAKITEWPKLMEILRKTPGVQVVILNHPRNKHSDFIPFAPEHYDARTGENRRGFPFTFDAIELVNSSALRTDDLLVFRDWLALLNSGVRAAGVGSSDCHEVNRYVVGQGRTYLEADDRDPGAIDVGAACEALKAGRSSVSLGLLTRIKVDGKAGSGALVAASGSTVDVEVRVWGPHWVRADRVELYVNGVLAAGETLEISGDKGGEKIRATWRIPRPPTDAHLVAVATGPGVRELYWPLSRPYQPDAPAWTPKVIGIANPVWLDVDGDGAWRSPREVAKDHVGRHRPEELMRILAELGEAVAAQAAGLLRALGTDFAKAPWPSLLESTPPPLRRHFINP